MKTKDFSWAIDYILNLVGQATPKRPPQGLDPTLYQTGTYEGDLELLDTTNQAIDLISTSHQETEKLTDAAVLLAIDWSSGYGCKCQPNPTMDDYRCETCHAAAYIKDKMGVDADD